MTDTPLMGKKIAALVADGFEQSELTGPMQALQQAGAEVAIVSPQRSTVRGWQQGDWGDAFPIDIALDEVQAFDFDGLLLPGGVMNPDQLRINRQAVLLVRNFFDLNLAVAAICHGPWTLIDAGVVPGRTLTSYPSLQTDLKNAGANWVDQAVVVDRQLVTSRHPGDIPAFNQAMIELLAQGVITSERDLTPTSATANSFDSPTTESLGDDPATMAGNTLSNPQIKGPEHIEPYYPSGKGPLSEPGPTDEAEAPD